MDTTTNLKNWLVMAMFLLMSWCASAWGDVIYVDEDAYQDGDGTTWGTAYKYLQDALTDAQGSGKDIWVAEGTYQPDEDEGGNVTPRDRTATFQLISGVALCGGFPTSGGWQDRDPNAHETILSGDINTPAASDNSYHVVTGSGTDPNSVLDGFTITAGNANGSTPHDTGGGMYNDGGDLTVTNCTFSGNSGFGGGGISAYDSNMTLTNCTITSNSASASAGGGGGVFTGSGGPVFVNCTFAGNFAQDAGGAMHNVDCTPTLTNCLFSGNTADWDGGGMFNNESSPVVTNCTFSGNSGTVHGGGISNEATSNPRLWNCILWANTAAAGSQIGNDATSSAVVYYSDVEGGWPGPGRYNIDADPCFADPGQWTDPCGTPGDANDDVWRNGDYHLKSQGGRWDPNSQSWVLDAVTSPCIDKGNPASDIADEPYPNGGKINMGAYGGTAQASKSSVITCWEALECAGQTSGDATCDGSVNLADLFALKAHFGKRAPWTPPECCPDYNHDDSIDLADLFTLKAGFGTSGYSPSTTNQNCPP